jgi:integrase/recombinase XerD
MLLFLADTGCRRAELVNLRLSDIDLAGKRALLTEKGRESRYVLLGDATKTALEAWLAKRPDGTDRVFVGQRGPLTTNAVNLMIARLKTQAGVTGPVSPQSLRHAFAKLYLKSGGDLASLAGLMGHTDVAMTRDLYSIFLDGELKRQHQHQSPMDTILGFG